MAASSTSGELPDELQTCAGLGWVKFGAALSGVEQAPLGQPPEIRCFGRRFSQAVAAAAVGRHSGATGSSTGPAAASAPAANTFAKVGDATSAVACVGQLSLIVRTAGPPARLSATVAQQAAPYFRCDGLSFKVERVAPAHSKQGAVASVAAEEPRDAKKPASTEAEAAANYPGEEMAQGVLRYGKAVADRASAIVSSVGGAANNANGPVKFATDMGGAAEKICRQAGKIAARSAQQVGQIASLPLRLLGSGSGSAGEAAAGGEGRPGGG